MNKEHVTTSEEVNTLERTAERFADQYASKDDLIFWKMAKYSFMAGYRSALPETTAEEIAERKSNGEMFLVCHKGEWIYVESITSEGKTYLSQPQGLFWHNVYSWSDYKILGPLRSEVLDDKQNCT